MLSRYHQPSIVFSLIFAATSVIGAEPADEAQAAEAKRLAGNWTLTFVDFCGVMGGKVNDASLSIKFHDGKVSLTYLAKSAGDVDVQWNPEKTPMEFDFIDQVDGKTIMHRGIYKLDGDSLTLVLGDRDGPRPTDFTTIGKQRMSIVLKRDTPKP